MSQKLGIKIHLESTIHDSLKEIAKKENRSVKNLIETFIKKNLVLNESD